ncbi:MAG: phosphoribosyltransferase [Aigarchaeota archaeon]|nr:phosphoribosyltransferase [Candidatus Pelearchaeum maunauluense]
MALLALNGQKYLALSWRDVESLVDKLYDAITRSYEPNVIVGVLRGGIVVANLLSDLFGMQEVYAIGCRSYRDMQRSEVRIYHDLVRGELRGKNVLLVDDVSDSGNTLTTAIEHVITPRSPSTVKTATLHIKPWTSYIPNFYVETTDAWIIYPWERMETVRILGRRFMRSMASEDVVRELSKLTRVSEEVIRQVLEEISGG